MYLAMLIFASVAAALVAFWRVQERPMKTKRYFGIVEFCVNRKGHGWYRTKGLNGEITATSEMYSRARDAKRAALRLGKKIGFRFVDTTKGVHRG